MDILERIVQAKRAQIARDKAESPVRRMIELATTALPPRDLSQALRRAAGMAVIAEIKRASPSKGEIKPGADVAAIAGKYEQAGAAALSVLTEAGFFLGAPEHLGEAKRAVSVPILRKDFILEEYQVYESRVLTSRELGTLIGVSRSLHMEPLVEVHSEEEAERALGAGAAILGVNNRDLATMTVSIENSLRIAPRLPAGILKVSESGIESSLDIERLRGAGYDAVLVGERLMREADPGAALRALIGGPA
jgi:indole-3-glycerol phosphate synthase